MITKSTAILTVVNQYITDIIEYIGVMIDNADLYYGWFRSTVRDMPAGGKAYIDKDIDNIEQAAIRCIKIVDKLKN